MSGVKLTIVGAGIMGLSVAWAAVRAGHRVTVVEQGAIPNEAAASNDETRLIRHVYGAMDGYARMVDPAFAAWREVWETLGTVHYLARGTLCLKERDSPWFDRSAAGAERLGLEPEWLDAEALAARFPPLNPPEGSRGFFVPTGGLLLARAILADLAGWLTENGAVLMTDSRVAAIEPERAACTLAEGGTLEADRLVVAAGPWTGALTGPDVAVTPSRQVAAYAHMPAAHAEAWSHMPMLLDIGQESGTYIVPPAPGGRLKLGTHRFSRAGDPDDDRLVGRAEAAAVLEDCARWLRAPELYTLSHGRACYYTLAPEERFIVRPLAERTWIMTGFSGHGFKFGPLLGKQVVAALEGPADAATVTALAAGHSPDTARKTHAR